MVVSGNMHRVGDIRVNTKTRQARLGDFLREFSVSFPRARANVVAEI